MAKKSKPVIREMDLAKFKKIVVKQLRNAHPRCPVLLEAGKHRELYWTTGERNGHWTTPSGNTVVVHPGAYRWLKVYHRSTLTLHISEERLEELWKLSKGWMWADYKINALFAVRTNGKLPYCPGNRELDAGPVAVVKAARKKEKELKQRNRAHREQIKAQKAHEREAKRLQMIEKLEARLIQLRERVEILPRPIRKFQLQEQTE